MAIQRGDYVRPNNTSVGLPRDSVWRVVCAGGRPLMLEPENETARCVNRRATQGCRFPARDFDKVVLRRGQWAAVNEADSLREPFDPFLAFAMRPFERSQNFQNLPETQTNAAAKAKVEEGKRQLAARLHADRCLGEATMELIAEVSRLNNGGSEQVAHSSIAAHVDQLQPLAKSYGYRIAKPSLLAQVVKL